MNSKHISILILALVGSELLMGRPSNAEELFRTRVCQSVPPHKVKFTNASDILFPPVKSEEEANGVYVVEQIVYPALKLEQIQLVVRDKTGGLHLASPDSLQGAVSRETLDRGRDGRCLEDNPNIYRRLQEYYEKDRNRAMAEAYHKVHEDDDMLCSPPLVSKVSLNDQALARVSQTSSLLRVKPLPFFGGGWPDASQPTKPVSLLNNSFVLVGQLVPGKNAPSEFHTISDREEAVISKPTMTGKFVIRDQHGVTHLVTAEDLADSSKSVIAQNKFVCKKPMQSSSSPDVIDHIPEHSTTISQ
jgi:hypothetical protein